MTKIKCPFPDCEYETEDVQDQLAATLLTIHASGMHTPAASTSSNQTMAAQVEKVRRPTITTAGTSEEWLYF